MSAPGGDWLSLEQLGAALVDALGAGALAGGDDAQRAALVAGAHMPPRRCNCCRRH